MHVVVDENKCTHCGLCKSVCLHEAITVTDHSVIIDEERCEACGACITMCCSDALGYELAVAG
ncbi:MAG: ferredoxin [Chitinivibrionales bacterium]|nr:ferredoxin [Chitinivibrionales bacterium]